MKQHRGSLWLFGCAGLLMACAGVARAGINDVRINEAYASETGADTVEFVEFYGPAGTSLAGLTLVVIDGDGTTKGNIINIDNLVGTIPADGLWVLGSAGTPNPGAGNPPDQLISQTLQNGTQTYLLVAGFTGTLGEDVDTNNDGAIDGTYTKLGTIVDSVGVNDGGADSTYAGAPTLGPACSVISPCEPAGVARRSNGVDTNTTGDWTITSFDLVPPATGTGADGFPAASPGLANTYVQNNVPVAQDGSAQVPAGSATGVVITLAATDDGIPNSTLSYQIVAAPTKGSLSDPDNGNVAVGAGGALAANHVRYIPQVGQSGADSFTFKANDGALDSNTATVNVTIQVNQAPQASNGNLTVPKNANPGSIVALSATDDGLPSATLAYRITVAPTHGTLTDSDNADAAVVVGTPLAANHVRYTPTTNYTGSDSFTFMANDGALDSNTATVSVLVTEPNTGVIITEIMYNPAGTEPNWEWAELANLGTSPVALKTLTDTTNISGNLTGLTIAGHGVVIITRLKTTDPTSAEFLTAWSPLSAEKVFQTATAGAWPQLNNGTETLTLSNANDQVLDVVAYQSGSGWPTSTSGKSIYLKSDHLTSADNDSGANWLLSASGTDGAYTSTGATPDIGSPGTIAGFPPAGGQHPVLTAAVSEKTHGAAGTFPIDLKAAGATEDRTGGPTKIVVTFDIPIQTTNGNNSVSLSSGSVSLLTVAGNQLTIDMSGATDHQPLTIGFAGVADATAATATSASALCFGVQFGDVNQDRATNIFDLVVVRNVLNTAASAGTFRMDPSADGSINIFDLVQMRNVLNTSVAACP